MWVHTFFSSITPASKGSFLSSSGVEILNILPRFPMHDLWAVCQDCSPSSYQSTCYEHFLDVLSVVFDDLQLVCWKRGQINNSILFYIWHFKAFGMSSLLLPSRICFDCVCRILQSFKKMHLCCRPNRLLHQHIVDGHFAYFFFAETIKLQHIVKSVTLFSQLPLAVCTKTACFKTVS